MDNLNIVKKNLILTTAIGYKFDQIKLFVKSLRVFYNGAITFLIGEKDFELEQELTKYNCNFIKTKINKKEIQFKRYELYLSYLKKNTFEEILLCDSRDIYFQANPFDFNFKGQINFFLEDKKIKDCKFNSNWILKTYGKKELLKIADCTILCSGTVLGKYKKILEYLQLITHNVSRYSYKKKLKYWITFRPDPEGRGCDQGHANYLVHNSKIDNLNFYSNSKGPVATVFYLKKILFDKNSFLINEKGEPYMLVHQYDKRWDKFEKPIDIFKSNIKI